MRIKLDKITRIIHKKPCIKFELSNKIFNELNRPIPKGEK